MNKTEFHNVPLNDIDPDPNQPRKMFDEAALVSLAASIREQGVIQPIEIRPCGNGRYLINHGERRWRAAQMAELETIPAIVSSQPRSDEEMLIRGLVENLQREDMAPIDEAEAYQALLDTGMNLASLTVKLGRARATIESRLAWLALEPEIRALVNAGKLPVSERASAALLKIQDSQTRVKLAQRLAVNHPSIKAVEGTVSRVLKRLEGESESSSTRVVAPALTFIGKRKYNKKGVRSAAQAMCEGCFQFANVKMQEPAWTLLATSAETMCKRCEAWEPGDSFLVCQSCPGVVLLKGMMAGANV